MERNQKMSSFEAKNVCKDRLGLRTPCSSHHITIGMWVSSRCT